MKINWKITASIAAGVVLVGVTVWVFMLQKHSVPTASDSGVSVTVSSENPESSKETSSPSGSDVSSEAEQSEAQSEPTLENVSSDASESNDTSTAASSPESDAASAPESDAASAPESDASSIDTSGSEGGDTSGAEVSAPETPDGKPPIDSTTPDHITDIHDMSGYNPIYNISNLYEVVYRYNAWFEQMEGYRVCWSTFNEGNNLGEVYDAQAAVTFAKEHWYDELDICAPFISRCLKVGGLTIGSDSSTSLFLQFLNSGLGFGEFLPINDDRTVTLPDYAQEGDIIQVYCPYEGLMIHSLIFVGNDEEGHMKICAHNPANSGESAFHAERVCYDCLTPLHEVFYFHFFDKRDKDLPNLTGEDGQRITLFEQKGWGLPETYDRDGALKYAMQHMSDGLGMKGADHISACLYEGGNVDIGYSIQSALFVQLLKSRLGSAHSVSINNDRTVYLPDYARPGDVGFVYCPEDGMMISSFIISGKNSEGKMLTYTIDMLNRPSFPYKIDSVCVGCDAPMYEVVLYCFDD